MAGRGAGSRQLLEHNLLGTVNLLEAAARRRAGIVILSTSRVYSIQGLASLPLRDRAAARFRFVAPDGFRAKPNEVTFDMADADCEGLAKYYNVSDARFVEYLCTLGVVRNDGRATGTYRCRLVTDHPKTWRCGNE
jgi:nucleoside-diphosphate-sugar epimerase